MLEEARGESYEAAGRPGKSKIGGPVAHLNQVIGYWGK